MNELARRLGRWLPLLLWMAIIFAVSHTPTQAIPGFGAWDLLIKKGSHFLAYAILALLAHRAIAPSGQGRGRQGRGRQAWVHYGWAWLVAAVYAISDEYHQTFTPGRNGNVADVLIDALGALTALLALANYEKRRDSLAALFTNAGGGR
jgi:VanZ family protein